MSSLDVKLAREALTDNRFYKYRGCAPHPDRRLRGRAAGNPELSVNAWFPPDRNGGEDQAERTAREDAAVEVCLSCPVMVLCDVWASQVDDDGKLAEEHGVAGGRRSLERHQALIRARSQAQRVMLLRIALAAGGRVVDYVLLSRAVQAGVVARSVLDECRSPQKQGVLRGLAASSDEDEVAGLAGVDTRTANWHRSKLCLLLGLDRESATRMDLLRAARRRGLLPAGTVLVPDGPRVVAAAPTNDGVRQRRIRSQHEVQLALLDMQLDETTDDDLMERAA